MKFHTSCHLLDAVQNQKKRDGSAKFRTTQGSSAKTKCCSVKFLDFSFHPSSSMQSYYHGHNSSELIPRAYKLVKEILRCPYCSTQLF